MRAYSMDLRERVLRDSDAGINAAAVAVTYHVSASWVRRLKQRRRETGDVAPRPQRYGRHPVLAPQLHTLAALIQEQPDRTLAELQVALAWRAILLFKCLLYSSYSYDSSRCIHLYRQDTPGTSGTRRDNQHPSAWRHVEGARATEGQEDGVFPGPRAGSGIRR